MPTKPRPKSTRSKTPPPINLDAIRRVAGELADRNAITYALADLVDDAAGDVLRSVPPATNRVAGDRLVWLLNALHASTVTGRVLARRLCALTAKVRR